VAVAELVEEQELLAPEVLVVVVQVLYQLLQRLVQLTRVAVAVAVVTEEVQRLEVQV